MIIRGYGVELHLLGEEDLELVREKRNSEFIRSRMQFREEITPEMQRKWFQSIHNENNNYYVVVYGNEKVGLISGNQVDWEKRETGNGGLFIWDEKYRDSIVPISASLLLTDITFLIGLERVRARVLQDNPKAIYYNLQLGFQLLPGQEKEENQLYELTREAYEKRTAKLKEILQRQYGKELVIAITDPALPFPKKIVELYSQLPAERKTHFKLVTE